MTVTASSEFPNNHYFPGKIKCEEEYDISTEPFEDLDKM